jgi:hypothetical protein
MNGGPCRNRTKNLLIKSENIRFLQPPAITQLIDIIKPIVETMEKIEAKKNIHVSYVS